MATISIFNKRDKREGRKTTEKIFIVGETYAEPRMVVFRLGTVDGVFADIVLLRLDRVFVHLFQHALGELDVTEERVTAVLSEVFPDDDAQHLEVVRVWRHGIRRDDPSTGTL